MPMRVDIFHDKKNNVVVYEEMIEGKSYIFIRAKGELVQIPAPIWRKIAKAWEEKGWSEKWDVLEDMPPLLDI
jgi:hypothetical protein